MNNSIKRLVIATAAGATAVALFLTIVTISGEEYAPLKNWLKSIFYHHWLGKSYLAAALFFLISLVSFPFTKNLDATSAIWIAFTMNILASFALTAFFLLHTLHLV